MGARFPSVFSNTILANVPATGAETIVLTTPALTLPFDGAAVFLIWSYAAAMGTGTTAATPKLYRGTSLTAPLLLTGPPNTVVAGNTVSLPFVFVDVNPGPAAPQYSLSFLGSNTTGAWGAGSGALLAFAL